MREPMSLLPLMGALVLTAHAVHGTGVAAASPSPEPVIRPVEGYGDWWLPAYVRVSPYSGYTNCGAWAEERRRLPRYQDGHIHFFSYASAQWCELNPAEDIYDWDRLDRMFGPRNGSHQVGINFYIKSYAKNRTARGKARPSDIPDWVVKKGKVKFLPNGAVAAWEPGCGYQKYYGKMLKAIGARYKDHPRLVAVDMRGLDRLYGEWCWRGGREDLAYAETHTGLTPQTFQAWGTQYVDDYVEAFKGHEGKLVWQCGEDTFISRNLGSKHDYGPASRAIWRHAYARGCGGRDGMPTVWYRYLNEGHGNRLTEEGYLESIKGFAPFTNGAMWYSENTEYFGDNERWKKDLDRFGGEKNHRTRWFISTMRVMQMRRNWQWVRGPVIEQLDAFDPEFMRWVDYQMGKTAQTSPEAWCWLREGYLRFQDDRPVKNFERWLLQRDVAPDGRTVPVEKVDISALKYNYASGKGYEFHARRTDRASRSGFIYFRAEPEFISGRSHDVMVKVQYLDGPATQWRLEYTGARGLSRSQAVETAGSGAWKSASFTIPDMSFTGGFRGKTDLRIAVLGPADLTVKLVRLIKLVPPRT